MGAYLRTIIICFIIGIVYLIISIRLADEIYGVSKIMIDELFHIPQGLSYCYYEFNKWDPKITTLPGLYLLSTFLCNILQSCTAQCMRFTNILAGLSNIYLCIAIRKEWHGKEPLRNHIMNAVNISLLPPLLFFTQVYYTDVASLTTVLGLTYFGLKEKFFMSIIASFFGFYSILMRQTNVIYVVMITGIKTLGIFHSALLNPKNYEKFVYAISQKDVYNLRRKLRWNVLKSRINSIDVLHIFEIASNASVVFLFLCFIIINGGIVVGDKQAHPVTINLPQIFYFALFTLFFAWMHFIQFIIPFIKMAMKNKLKIAFALCIIAIIVHLNTFVHPYLLADNRHYTFYVWARFYNTNLKRLCLAPVYVFALFGILRHVFNQSDLRFCVTYIPCVMLVLCLQGLIDVRYFLTPFVLFRLYLRNVSYKCLFIEFLFFVVINLMTFYIFFTKEVMWDDFKEVQRIIW